MSDSDEKQWYVAEVGSGRFRHGFTNSDGNCGHEPKNCVGIPNYSYVANAIADRDALAPVHSKDRYNAMLFGGALDGETSQAGMCHIKWPVERGVVKDMDIMNDIFHHELVDEGKLSLRADEDDESDIAGVMHIESMLGPTQGRIDMATNYFEKFGIPKLFFGLSSICALYGNGRVTGTCVMSGHGVTEVAPVFEGHGVKNAFKRYNWGGVDVTRWLGRELHKCDVALETTADELILWNIKEHLCCAPMGKLDEQITERRNLATEFELPDNTKLQLREQVVEVAEIIFDPKLAGHDIPGLAQMTWNAIQRCPTDSKKSFMQNILLFGGNTMVKGLKERMTEEMNAFSGALGGEECKVIAQPERCTNSWTGANILACQPEFSGAEDATKAMWIGKAEFDEMGGDRVVRMSAC